MANDRDCENCIHKVNGACNVWDCEFDPKFGTWIPVSERLPEGADYCLCCDKDGYMAIGRMSNWSSYWCFDDDNTDIDVIAWMPLPEPYKAEGGDKE